MKWIVSVEFRYSRAYHEFFKLVNRGRIKDTKLINFNATYKIIEFETTTKPDEGFMDKTRNIVNAKIVEVHETD